MLEVLLLTLQKILFEGRAKSVILPGEAGVFEVLAFHKPFLTRLLSGPLYIDGQRFFIRRGIARVGLNKVTVIVEEAAAKK